MTRRWLAVLVALAACGSEAAAPPSDPVTETAPVTTAVPETAATAATTATTATTAVAAESAPVLPVTVVDDTGASVTVDDVSRIIPVNGDLAEVVWALGLGDQVVATDISATYPPAADASPKIGYQRALAAETILAYEPTLILADELAGPPEVIEQLRDAGVPIVVVERRRTIDGPARKVTSVAAALGVPQRGAELVATMQREIDAALADAQAAVQSQGRPRVLALYLRGTSVQLAFGKGSGIDVFIDAAGGVDVGTEAGIVDTQELSIEAVVEARPDIILVTTSGLESVGGVDALLAIPGIDHTPAAATRSVVAFEDQFLYGFGPRSGQLLRELVAALHPS